MKIIQYFLLAVHTLLTLIFIVSYASACRDAEFFLLFLILLISVINIDYTVCAVFFLLPFVGNNPGNGFIPLLIIACLLLGYRSIIYLLKNLRETLSIKTNAAFFAFVLIFMLQSVISFDFATLTAPSGTGSGAEILLIPARILFAQEFNPFYTINFFILFYGVTMLYIFCIYFIRKHSMSVENLVKLFSVISNLLIAVGLVNYFTVYNIPLFYPNHYYYLSIPRLSAFFLNPGWYAQFLCFVIFPNIYFIFKAHKWPEKAVFILFSIITLVSAILSVARALYLSLFITGSLAVLYLLFQFIKNKKSYVKIITALVLSLLIFASIYSVQEKSSKIETLADNPRTYLFDYAFRIFMKNPLWGSGIGSYGIESQRFFSDHTPVIVRYFHSTAHNTYLQLLSEGGLLLLVPFMVFLGLIIFRRTPDPFILSLKASILCLLIYGLFQYLFYITIICILFFFYLAIIANHKALN